MMETTAGGGGQGGAVVDVDALLHCLTQWIELVRRKKERERQTERQRDRQTDRQTDRQRETKKEGEKEMDEIDGCCSCENPTVSSSTLDDSICF